MSIYAQFKICSKCGIEKPISSFWKNKSIKSGFYCSCIDCLKEERNEYRNNNREKLREYHREYQKNLRKNNPEKRRNYKNQYEKTKKETDSLYKFKHNMRKLVIQSIHRHGYTKRSKTTDIVGCDWNTLKEHIESQFDCNMSWDNQGTYWDIDHIIPISLATTEEETIKLNHYSNLRPLESYFNRHIKRAKL